MGTSLLVGTARVDITPPLSIPYLGFEPRHALFEGVHDPLHARAVALDDGACQVILIAADSIGYSNELLGPGRNFTQEVRERIQQRTGAPADHIMLASSHVHSAPETIHLRTLLETTPAAAAWLEVLMDQLASAAAMAMQQRKPSILKSRVGQLAGLSRNRRIIGSDGRITRLRHRDPNDKSTSSGPIDPDVGVIYLESAGGASCTVISNFACHPVTVQVQPLVSADYPGPAMAFVENSLPACANSLFLQGACGDINPVRNTTNFEDVERYGLMLGAEIVKQVARLRDPDYGEGPTCLAVASETLHLEVRELPPRSEAQRAYNEASRRLSAAQSETEKDALAREQRMAEEQLILLDRGSAPIPAEVQVIRIGDIALAALPGEPFVDLGLAIKERSIAPSTFVVGYANDWIGYLTTPQAWVQGGYEVSYGPWTRVGPDGGTQLVNKAVQLIEQLWS